MITCDDGGDPNQAADCARDLVAAGVVADVNATVISSADVVVDTFLQGGVPRLDGNPAPVALSAANTYGTRCRT